ncbi:MAG: hypothetical protein IKR12_03105 [Clostridia bacterium]|nr:hypothetical protein [Clostridia bacterium]
MVMFAGVVLYVWATRGFNPPYVPLADWYWASEGRTEDAETDPEKKTEFVIDGNKEIELDADGHQKKDNNGNLIWKQKTDANGKPVYDSIYIVPNKGCTELDAVLEISFSSNPSSLILQLVEDDNVKAIKAESEEEQQNGQTNNQEQDRVYTKYNVKINSPIYLRPLTKKAIVNGAEIETNVGGWVKLTATQGLITTHCWVFVDSSIVDLKLELNQDIEPEEDGNHQQVYNIYPNSVLSVKNIVSPSDSLILPSTTNPAGKGATEYTNKKSIYYQTSNTEVASIDNYGNITIMPHKEGETFTVNAYIVANYNNIGHEPNIQDYEGDPSQDAIVPYTRAFDKIRVWSNTLTFKINEISVVGLTTGSKSINVQPYSVFESGTISFSDLETNPRKNNFYVDLQFSNTTDESYKNTLLSQIQLYIGYEEGLATDIPDSVKSVEDIVMNGKKIEDASKYITLEKENGVYHYTVNEYSESKFYIFFYYDMQEEEIMLWDYIPISLQKVKVTSISSGNAVSLLYSDDSIETYSLNNFATITPANSTYKNILYFVPSSTNLVETDDSIKAYIAGKECVAIASQPTSQESDLLDYYKITPISSGKTVFYAAVVRTTERIEPEDFVAYITESKEYLIFNQDGYVEIEYSSEFVNITISKVVTITGIESSVNANIEDDDPDYNFAKDCAIFARVYKGEDINIEISYDGTTDALENGRLSINLLAGADETVASLTNQDNTVDGTYTFKIVTNKVGNVKYQVIYNGELQYTIGVVVLTTELSGLNLQTTNNTLTIDFVAGDDDIATGYKWKDLALSLEFNSPKTNDINFEIETYAVVDDYVDILYKYTGRDYAEVITGVPEEINTIEKLISKLTKTESIIKVYANQVASYDANIVIEANEQISFAYDFVGVGRVFVVARSITTDIYSNPVLVNIEIPEVKIIRGTDEITTKQIKENVVSYGEMMSIDNHITPAKQINLFGAGTEFITFVAEVGNRVYDLQKLVFFKFEEQTATEDEYTSTKSGAKIALSGSHAVLTLCDISKNYNENIIAYTNFGYLNDEFYQYNLVPNYKLIANTNGKTYYTPNIIDLFTGTSSVCGDILFTDINYDYNNPIVVVGNRLYLPNNFATSITELETKMPAEYISSFYYEDEENQDEYYHIYIATINVVTDGNDGNNYTKSVGYKINLKYKTTNQKIDVRFATTSGYLLSTKITVDAGATYNGTTNKNVQSSDLESGITLSDILSSFSIGTEFGVEITGIDFAVGASTSEDLSFYYESADSKYVQTFVEVLAEDINYKSESEYDELSNEQKAGYTQYYIKTSDVGIVAGKHYYIKNNNEEFELVQTPSIDDIENNSYYDKVYVDSTKTYYGNETYYEEIPAALLSKQYVDKYYVKNQSGEFELAVASQFNVSTQYYYKKNYKQKLAGSDITEVFELVTISLAEDSANYVLSASAADTAKLQNISDSIDLSFVITIKIKNNVTNAFDSYNMRYNISLV